MRRRHDPVRRHQRAAAHEHAARAAAQHGHQVRELSGLRLRPAHYPAPPRTTADDTLLAAVNAKIVSDIDIYLLYCENDVFHRSKLCAAVHVDTMR